MTGKPLALRWVERCRSHGTIGQRPRDLVAIGDLGADMRNGYLWRKFLTFSDNSQAVVSEGNGYIFVDWWCDGRRRLDAACEKRIPDWLGLDEAPPAAA